jgi:hypothetical protein
MTAGGTNAYRERMPAHLLRGPDVHPICPECRGEDVPGGHTSLCAFRRSTSWDCVQCGDTIQASRHGLSLVCQACADFNYQLWLRQRDSHELPRSLASG